MIVALKPTILALRRRGCLTTLVKSLLDAGRTIIRLAETGGLRIFLRTKPAIRLRQGRITATTLQVINAHISGDAGAHGEFALDAAT